MIDFYELTSEEKQDITKPAYSIFRTKEGKIILRDLEETILKNPFWSSDDPSIDSLKRDGARELLCFIYEQIGNINN